MSGHWESWNGQQYWVDTTAQDQAKASHDVLPFRDQLSASDQNEYDVLHAQAPTMADSGAEEGNAASSRGAQMAALAAQQQMAQGNGPSVAALQQRSSMGQALSQALAGGAGRMGAPMLAQGQMGMAQAQQGADQARAQEIGQAMHGYAQGANQFRGADASYRGLQDQQLAHAQQLQFQQEQMRNALVHGYEQNRFAQSNNATQQAQTQYHQQVAQQQQSDARNDANLRTFIASSVGAAVGG